MPHFSSRITKKQKRSRIVMICNCFTSNIYQNDPTKHENWKMVNNNGSCGLSPSQRIIGGVDAGLGNYPWIVRLGSRSSKDRKVNFKCGGTIINKKYVVTANHCYASHEKMRVVRVGEYDERTNPDCDEYENCAPPYKDYRVNRIIYHNRYRHGVSFVNDITLLRIKGEFEFNDFVMPICLEYGSLLNNTYIAKNAEVTGWGIFDLVKNKVHPVLQKLVIPVLDPEICYAKMNKYTPISTTKQICAGGIIGKDSCSGDSGGPLMIPQAVDNMPPRYFLIGIVSFGVKDCGMTVMPAIYTRVSAYLPWILNNIHE